MTFEEYQKAARRTQNGELSTTERMRHGLYGLASETGEVLALFQKGYQGHPVDKERVMDECGDVLWMLAEVADCVGFTLDQAAQHNADKLWRRYPTGFDSVRSVHRGEE